MLAEVLRVTSEQRSDCQGRRHDLRLMLAQSDFDRYIDVLQRVQGNEQFDEVRSERINRLRDLRSAKRSRIRTTGETA